MTTEQSGFLRRIEDLSERCERQSVVAATGFLTPAEQFTLHAWAERRTEAGLFLSGGQEGCERQRAFFLPYWLTPEDLDLGEHIRAIRADAFFGEPGHRDYLGAVLGLGIQREWIGDIRVFGASAYLFCLPSVEALLLDELGKVGRVSVRTASVSLEDVPAPERQVKKVSFTVKSLRLDAVTSSLFGLSRTQAADLIRMGAASLNYASCERTDAPVKEGDVISLRGRGKGVLTAVGGRSRKDRLFVEAEILL